MVAFGGNLGGASRVSPTGKEPRWSLVNLYTLFSVFNNKAVALKHIAALKISESNNLADIMTKYLKFVRWRRLMDTIMNITVHAKPIQLDRTPCVRAAS